MVSLPGWSSVDGGFVMDVVPGDCVVPAGAGGLADGEDEPPVEGLPQQHQNPPALRGVGQEGPS